MKNQLDQLKKEGKLTPYLYKISKDRLQVLPIKMQSEIVKEAAEMSKLGINSSEDHKTFFYIIRHARQLSKELSGYNLHISKLSELSHLIFVNRQNFPVDTIFNFYKATAIALNKMQIPIKKLAYPQGDGVAYIQESRDIQKWMQAMREIYALGQSLEYDIATAFKAVTADWDKMEKKDFKNWMSFYEENAQNKYKTAQENKYYQFGPGAMIPIDHLRAKLPNGPDMSQYDRNEVMVQHQQQTAQKDLEVKKKEEIKKKIKAIISRLNAAERLATDPEVQKDLQQCLDVGVPKWLEELQRVKRLVQLAPIKSYNSSILEDLVIKQANILQHQGFPKAAHQMRILAQNPVAETAPTANTVAPMASTTDGIIQKSDSEDGEDALDELVDGMNSDDAGDANDIQDVDNDPLAAITVMAQAAHETQEPATLEVEEPVAEQSPTAETKMDAKTDALFESALSQVTIKDVILRLETLANLFRTREIPRQLAIIDLMMDKLNISAFFPSLAEASSKSLESNQYALTRVEDILSKLRGSVETPKHMELDLTGKGTGPIKPIPENIDNESVRSGLAKQDEMEKARKERRKTEDLTPQTQPETSQEAVTNIPEELAQPAAVVPTR